MYAEGMLKGKLSPGQSIVSPHKVGSELFTDYFIRQKSLSNVATMLLRPRNISITVVATLFQPFCSIELRRQASAATKKLFPIFLNDILYVIPRYILLLFDTNQLLKTSVLTKVHNL